MDLLNHLSLGFSVAFIPINLLYAFVGVLLGTLIGVLPGIGPVATIAMLLPTTYALQPVSALIMLAGIYYGAQYGGSTTSILINMPGETSSAVTCLDGYQMARKGEAGAALSIAAIGSFFAGCVATVNWFMSVLAKVAPKVTSYCVFEVATTVAGETASTPMRCIALSSSSVALRSRVISLLDSASRTTFTLSSTSLRTPAETLSPTSLSVRSA